MELRKRICEVCKVKITGFGKSHLDRNYDDHLQQQHKEFYKKKLLEAAKKKKAPKKAPKKEEKSEDPKPLKPGELKTAIQKDIEFINRKRNKEGKLSKTDLFDLNETQQLLILEKDFKMSHADARAFKNEKERVAKILELQG